MTLGSTTAEPFRAWQAETLADKRIVVAIDGWDTDSAYPSGHYVRTLGTIGDRCRLCWPHAQCLVMPVLASCTVTGHNDLGRYNIPGHPAVYFGSSCAWPCVTALAVTAWVTITAVDSPNHPDYLETACRQAVGSRVCWVDLVAKAMVESL